MTIILTAQENKDLWSEAAQQAPPQRDLAGVTIYPMPKQLGTGHELAIELYPNCWLDIYHWERHEDVQIKLPESDHPVQFGVLLSGIMPDSQDGGWGNGCTLISGSGMQRQMSSTSFSGQLYLGINLEMSAEWLTTFFPDGQGQLPAELHFLVRGNDWQTLIYPKTSPAIQQVTHEIIHCPYQKTAKRLFLQAKSQELMALILAPIMTDQDNPKPRPRTKPKTIARLYEAQRILQLQLDDPPSSLELAQQLGLSDHTLRRGFRELFGTTVVGYLTEQRRIQAEQLLRDQSMTVTEVAHRVGYGHLGHFAAAFKRKFGITPSQCLLGKKAVFG